MSTSSSSPSYGQQYIGSRSNLRWKSGDSDDLAVDFDSSLTSLTDLHDMPYTVSENLMSMSEHVLKEHTGDSQFQYVLGAPTSPATKITEETLTYLNQGQLYEVKLKQLGSEPWVQGKQLRSFCKISFHERRLRFSEKENVEKWRLLRPGERILDIDIPHSYGISDLRSDPHNVNVVEFLWNPAKEAGLYLKINCISTEFTIKKHGGEKGVSFRIQVDTYLNTDSACTKLLHCASCQVKVFKPKGAERKHKTDKDKIDKLPEAEKERYQPSYECTILSPMPLEQAMRMPAKRLEQAPAFSISSYAEKSSSTTGSTLRHMSPITSAVSGGYTEPSSPCSVTSSTHTVAATGSPLTPPSTLVTASNQTLLATISSPAENVLGENSEQMRSNLQQFTTRHAQVIVPSSSSVTVMQWLLENRFGHCARMFQNFTGADLLCLSREELIQICGVADGIRLNNSLLQRQARPRLSLFIKIAQSPAEAPVFQALYLSRASMLELVQKLTSIFGASASIVSDVLLHSTNGARVLVTDDVIENMADGIQYSMEIVPSGKGDKYQIILRSTST